MSPTKDTKADINEEIDLGGREPTRQEKAAAAKQEAEDHAKDQAAAAKLPIGAPDATVHPRPVPSPVETEAQAAAGPHRPEPARQIFHDPGAPPTPLDDPRPARARPARIRVRATQDGFYGDARRRAGSVFDIASVKEFSHKWMERVADSTPEQRLTAQERIDQEHDAINAGRVGGSRKPTGSRRVLDE